MAVEVDESFHTSMLPPMKAERDISSLIKTHRVAVCIGAGGVGKTTTSAALAMAAAQAGARTLCLTIDPARRLAQSLGIKDDSADESIVPDEFWSSTGTKKNADVTVMMLRPESVFRHLVNKVSHSKQQSESLLNHRLFDHVARHLPGTAAYMAVEKLWEVYQDKRFDFIVLDTPPSSKALEFFDAPQKLLDVINSPLTKTLASTGSSKSLHAQLFSTGLRATLKGLSKVTGAGFLEELAEFMARLDSVLELLRTRAGELEEIFHRDSVAYVAISTLESVPLAETERLLEQLEGRGLSSKLLLLNKSIQPAISKEGWAPEILAASPLEELDLSVKVDRNRATWQESALAGAGRRINEIPNIRLPYSPFRRSPAAQILFLAQALAKS